LQSLFNNEDSFESNAVREGNGRINHRAAARQDLLLERYKEQERLRRVRAKRRELRIAREEKLREKIERRRERTLNCRNKEKDRKEKRRLRLFIRRSTRKTIKAQYIYGSKHYPSMARKYPSETPLSILHRLGREYVLLAPEVRSQYEEIAAANRSSRDIVKRTVGSSRIRPFPLYVKEHYAGAAEKMPGPTGFDKVIRITKVLGAQWRSLSDDQRESYKIRAAQMRTDALRTFKKDMESTAKMKKYKNQKKILIQSVLI
jgi:hypothetical protein